MKTLRIGSGAGYSGDRIEPAVELAEQGDLDYLVFECLAERTIALAQQARISDPQGGYDPLLSERMRRVLPFVGEHEGRRRLRVITNMGAANPVSAAREVRRIASELGLALKVVAVVGDDVLDVLRPEQVLDNGQTLGSLGARLISANAYLGVDGILDALRAEADVVITGRVADPSLFLAPQMFEFGWAAHDWPRLASVSQRLVILLPQDWDERRDHALVLAQLGRRGQAAEELSAYLQHRPDASDAPALRRELASWRRGTH